MFALAVLSTELDVSFPPIIAGSIADLRAQLVTRAQELGIPVDHFLLQRSPVVGYDVVSELWHDTDSIDKLVAVTAYIAGCTPTDVTALTPASSETPEGKITLHLIAMRYFSHRLHQEQSAWKKAVQEAVVAGVKQVDIARQAGVSKQYIAQIVKEGK